MTDLSMTKGEANQQVYNLSTFVLNTSIADADLITSFPAPFAGEVVALRVIVSAPVTSAAKLSTLTVKINGTAVNGAAIATTSATMTPLGKVLSGVATANHATRLFAEGDLISVTGSATTSYIEGSSMIIVQLRRLA